MRLNKKTISNFQQAVLTYYRTHGRVFPWRPVRGGGTLRAPAASNGADPYGVLVSEIMLQQTQVERVIPKYREWMRKFPDLQTLARASTGDVLRHWQGLGYNRRALNLKRAAETIVREHDGEVPHDIELIDALPGVGPYTAGAIAAFAFGTPSAFVETNIRTVYLHFFFKNKENVRDAEILEVVEKTLPNKVKPCSVREWYNALMDYGAMLKATVGNPNIHSAHYMRQSTFKGSRRQLRGAILRKAAKSKTISPHTFTSAEYSITDVFSELVKEGFLKKEEKGFSLV